MLWKAELRSDSEVADTTWAQWDFDQDLKSVTRDQTSKVLARSPRDRNWRGQVDLRRDIARTKFGDEKHDTSDKKTKCELRKIFTDDID